MFPTLLKVCEQMNINIEGKPLEEMCLKFYSEQYILILLAEKHLWNQLYSGVASSISEGRAQLISSKLESVSKDINCAEHEIYEYVPPPIELATPLKLYDSP